MIDRILVPLDGSLVAEQILPHVRRFLFRHDSELVLVRAVAPPLVEPPLLALDSLLAASREYLLGAQERLAQQGVRVKVVTKAGSAPDVILEAVETEEATMVAMATHGETGLKRLLAGSVAQSVIKQSPVPVLAVRPFWSYELLPRRTDGDDHRPMRNILFPLDDSESAGLLLPHVVELARLFEARVILLEAGKEGETADDYPEALMVGVAARLERESVPTLTLKGRGDPARDILQAARSLEVDLIAMTSHAKSGFLGFLSGPTTQKILHESECPILIVRSPESAGAGRTENRSRASRK